MLMVFELNNKKRFLKMFLQVHNESHFCYLLFLCMSVSRPWK